jgi:hypothetical protein
MALSQAELKAVASLETSQFEAGANRISTSTGAMSESIKNIGAKIGAAFTIGAIVGFGKQMMQGQAMLERFSKTVGISAGMLDELGDKAAETGADAAGFQMKIVKMIEAQEKAVTGDVKMVEAFSKLGVSMQELTNSTPEKLLELVAKGAQDDATAIHNLNEIMGKGAAAEYGATLKDIAINGLPKVSKEAENAAKQFANINKQYEILKDKIGHGFMKAAVNVANFVGLGSESEIQSQLDKEQRSRAAQASARLKDLRDQQQALVDKVKLEGSDKEKTILDKRKKAIDSITVSAPTASDSLAAYGRMIGSQNYGASGVAERQLKELEIIAESTKELTKIQDDTNKKIEALGGE